MIRRLASFRGLAKQNQENRVPPSSSANEALWVNRGQWKSGQGVQFAEGRFGSDGVFVADEVLAKHDENYMPPEVAEALKEAGEWQGDTPAN